MSECIFCKIVSGEIPGEMVYEDQQVAAFKDINPAAPIHLLIIPKRHIASVNELEAEDQSLIGQLILTAKKLAEMKNIEKSGYRLIINTGPDGGQEVFHLHLHLLGGGKMQHPMG